MLDKDFKSLIAKKWAVIQKDTDKYMNQVRKTIQNLEKKGSNMDGKFSMEIEIFEKNRVEMLEMKTFSMEKSQKHHQ